MLCKMPEQLAACLPAIRPADLFHPTPDGFGGRPPSRSMSGRPMSSRGARPMSSSDGGGGGMQMHRPTNTDFLGGDQFDQENRCAAAGSSMGWGRLDEGQAPSDFPVLHGLVLAV